MAITPSQHWLTAPGTLPALYRGSVATHTAILRPIAITFTGEAEKMGDTATQSYSVVGQDWTAGSLRLDRRELADPPRPGSDTARNPDRCTGSRFSRPRAGHQESSAPVAGLAGLWTA